MELGESIPVIENFFYITSHRNRGAAWGILQGQMWFFYIVTILVVIFLIYYIQKHVKGQPLFGTCTRLNVRWSDWKLYRPYISAGSC